MQQKVLIIKNIPREGPGIIGELLKESGIGSDTVEIANISNVKSLSAYAAVIILGGPASANDVNPEMLYELELIRKVVSSEIPYLGICLGLQTLVKACGGQVIASMTKETGFRDPDGNLYSIKLSDQGRKDDLFKELPSSLTVFQLHGETVELTSRMSLLASGIFCPNQVVKIGSNGYGIQGHFELDRKLLEVWLEEDSDLRKADKRKILEDFNSLEHNYRDRGRKLFSNFLRIAGFNL
jgi:GMP synthase (glutamine-hydrolysing)